MTIENRVLFNLFETVKKGFRSYEMGLNGYGLYIEGFSGGVTVYAKGKALYRQTIYGEQDTVLLIYRQLAGKSRKNTWRKPLDHSGKPVED